MTASPRSRILILVALLTLALGLLASCAEETESLNEVGQAPADTGDTGDTGGGGGEAAENQVVIENFAFSPETITIQTGGTVTWTNKDSTSHTVTGEGGAFDSGTLSQGETFEHTFDSAGEFPYICSIHPSMTGTVVVQ